MKLYRSIATVSGFTAVSRLLGFVRDMLIAAVLGAGTVADAFFVAFRLPNLFRSLFAEGAFNSAFVPLFTKRLQDGGMDGARQFAEEALAVLMAALLIVSIMAEIAMPWLVRLIAPGFIDNPEKFGLAVLLTRITFPYLFCMSLTALSAGLLNAMGRFAAAAAAPIVLNAVTIGAMIIAASFRLYDRPEAAMILAWAVTVSGFAQLTLLTIAARRQGMDLGFRVPLLTTGVRRLFVLAGPSVVTAGITQINLFVGTMIASLAEGAVSFLYYADRINQLPLGIVGIAIGVVLLPELSQKLAAGNHGSAMYSHNRALEFALLLTLPAAAALCVVPGSDHSGSVPAWSLRRLRHACGGSGARGIRRRPAGLRADPRLSARLFRARGHADADDLCRHQRRGEHRRLTQPVLHHRSCRHRHRHEPCRMDQCDAARRDAAAPQELRAGHLAETPRLADRTGEPRHGLGALGRVASARPVFRARQTAS